MNIVVSRDGTRIAFDTYGDGPPVVLVGGALGIRGYSTALAGLLAPHLRVIAYDRRGRGDSGDTPPYGVDREIEDIAALVAETGGSALLYGHSSGAALALEAVLRGVDVTRLAVYEPPFLIDPGHSPLAGDYVQRLEGHIAAGHRGEAIEQFMREAVLVPPEQIAGMRGSPMWPSLEASAHTLVYDQAVMDRTRLDVPDPLARFASITVPTLTLDGGESPGWLSEPAKRLAGILPDATHLTLDGQNHGVDPAVLAPVLIEFFRS